MCVGRNVERPGVEVLRIIGAPSRDFWKVSRERKGWHRGSRERRLGVLFGDEELPAFKGAAPDYASWLWV